MTSRFWCFTFNNYTKDSEEELIRRLELIHAQYVWGHEIGEKCGTPHLQGYIQFKKKYGLLTLKTLFGDPIRWADREGTPKQAYVYCTKDGKDIVSNFPCPKGSGSRSDLAYLRQRRLEGATMTELLYDGEINNYQQLSFAEKIGKYVKTPKRVAPDVFWFYGETGLGKTRAAFELCGDDEPWISGANLKWFDGYDGHKTS